MHILNSYGQLYQNSYIKTAIYFNQNSYIYFKQHNS